MSQVKPALSSTMRIELPPDEQPSRRRILHKPDRDVPKHLRNARDNDIGTTDFQSFFENIYDGVLIVESGGRIREANPRAMRALQYDREMLLKMFLDQVVSGLTAEVLESIETTLWKDRHVFIQGYCLRKDGDVFPVDIAVNRLVLSEGQFFCFFLRDTSARHETESLLWREHQALEGVDQPVMICDADCVMIFANRFAREKMGIPDDFPLSEFPFADALGGIGPGSMWETVADGNVWSGLLEMPQGDTLQAVVTPTYDVDSTFNGAIFSLLPQNG